MQIEFHGVRGSLAAPGARTALVGGNTSCVEVRVGSERVVLDAGTGLRGLGERLVAGGPSDTTVLLSHLHWDHIQGLPFFLPVYQPGSKVRVLSGPSGVISTEEAVRRQMSAPFFPVTFDEVQQQVSARDLVPGRPFVLGPNGELEVRIARLNHPDPVWGYRLTSGGKSVVYATDTEHFSCVDPALRALAEGADVLIYDAQYTPEEYRGDPPASPVGGEGRRPEPVKEAVGRAKVGWGHSTYEAAAELARAAGVGRLVLFHHDPQRSDADVAIIERRAQALFPATVAAREGLVLDVA